MASTKPANTAEKSKQLIVSESLAVKYRPRTVDDMIGNKGAKAIIKGILKNGRVPNTILLHGGTGMGKTTISRMLCRYVNCAEGTGCGKCQSCQLIDSGRHPDVVEINAAEQRGIDDVRTLIQKSKLAPRFNFRIFILDELHQLTPQAAQAMLKPLEEPPSRTIWILATTNPEKLPKTVVGRCQRIEVNPPDEKEMIQFLIDVCKREEVKVQKDWLPLFKEIASLSAGHSRDALQMLESVLAVKASGEEIDNEQILANILKTAEVDMDKAAAKVLAALLKGQPKTVIQTVAQAAAGSDPRSLIYRLRWLADLKIGQWAGTNKSNPPISRLFDTLYKKEQINVIETNRMLLSLCQMESTLNTVPGLDPRILLSTTLADQAIRILTENKKGDD